MKKPVFIVILMFFFLAITSKSFAWGKKGHELVAEIAFNFLDDSTKMMVKSFLGNMSIEEAANWMDDERGNTYYNYMRTWHYVNVEKGENYKPSTERDIITILNSAIIDLKNYKSLKRKDVKRDLLLIFHLIGDLHQPLHVGYGIDRGGNSVEITSPVLSGNLHSAWDTDILEYKQITLDSCLKLYSEMDSQTVKQVENIDVLGWMKQSRSYLDTIYSFKNSVLTKEYVDSNAEVIKKQLLYAGLRLAGILKATFNPS